jgi:hypothetical protein
MVSFPQVSTPKPCVYRGADKSLDRPRRNKLQRQKILSFMYPTYNHNWRNISTIYITRLASNEIFSPSNKIHREVGRAKDLSALLYYSSPIRATCPVHLLFLNLMSPVIIYYLARCSTYLSSRLLLIKLAPNGEIIGLFVIDTRICLMRLIPVWWSVWLRSYGLCEGISSLCNICSADWPSECKSLMITTC